MQLVDAIFDGGAGEDKGVAAAEAFDGLGGLGAPVLDALGFVEHDDVWTKADVHVERIREHLFVIDDGEEGDSLTLTLSPPRSEGSTIPVVGQSRG